MTSKEQETAFYDQPDNNDRVEEFDDYLDETTPPIMIAGVKIVPSNALYEADPIAYQLQARLFQGSQIHPLFEVGYKAVYNSQVLTQNPETNARIWRAVETALAAALANKLH